MSEVGSVVGTQPATQPVSQPACLEVQSADVRSKAGRFPGDRALLPGIPASRLAAARFIRFWFVRSREAGRRWVRGGLRGFVLRRPVSHPRCGHGVRLASREEFQSQADLASQCVAWHEQWVRLLRRLDSGRAPLVLDLFCGAGGVTEGACRVGACAVGVDSAEQPSYVARFLGESFVLGDATDREQLRYLVRRFRPFCVWASPPCEGYSTATFAGARSGADRLIEEVRDLLDEFDLPYVIENVMGSRPVMRDHALLLRGTDFGLQTGRPRLIEGGGGFRPRLDDALRSGGDHLTQHSCLGSHARFPRLDPFGRRERVPCCAGNMFAVQGRGPTGGTRDEHAAALGIDASHMPYASLAKAVPPVYAAVCVGQMAMHTLQQRFGIRPISFDEMLARPAESRRALAGLLRGAGGESPSLGVSLEPSPEVKAARGSVEAEAREARRAECQQRVRDLPPVSIVESCWRPVQHDAVWYLTREGARRAGTVEAVVRGSCVEDESYQIRFDSDGHVRGTVVGRLTPRDLSVTSESAAGAVGSSGSHPGWTMCESDFREVDYTHAGGFDQHWQPDASAAWLDRLRPAERLCGDAVPARESWLGRNTFVHVRSDVMLRAWPDLRAALTTEGGGARVTIVVSSGSEGDHPGSHREECLRRCLQGFGFERVYRLEQRSARVRGLDGAWCRLATDAEAWHFGWRTCRPGLVLDHSQLDELFDPQDVHGSDQPPGRKAAISWSPMPSGDAGRWRRAGLPASVVRMMEEGVSVDVVDGTECLRGETPQYPWADSEHYLRGALECDRALAAGHLEPVPDDRVESALRDGHVHPWTVVHQSAEKWRAAQDYSPCTNRRVVSKPFTLTSVRDVRRIVKPSSRFAKYDLRDGFWSVPTARATRHHLMVRHPATGRLLWCRSLPFGYALSPLHFCSLTEAVAGVFRRRMAGRGVHIFVFCDDFLIVGEDEAATRAGMAAFEVLLEELQLPSAPHKKRGPARAIEFLGLLLVNRAVDPCVGLTAKRQARLVAQIADWQSRRRPAGERVAVEPRDLASFLGHLVFCSECIPGGRTFMQGMLRQFQGLEVDWLRGAVREVRCAWRSMHLRDEFWRDLHWWRSALEVANCVPMSPREEGGECALTGSDASDFGCGELVWLGGEREETQLLFTRAERRRPINFRELRGCLRVLELWGHRLVGRTVVVELDNSASVGAASKFYSRSADMQELVRRMLDYCQRFDLRLRVVHTPGAALLRPDRLSRSLMPEQPRLRLRRGHFARLEARFGPFDSFLGAEREHVRVIPSADRGSTCVHGVSGPRLWVHPAHETVAASLRMIGEQLSVDPSLCASGVVILPFSPDAAWWKLTRHLHEAGRFPEGSGHLEANRLGRWAPAKSACESIIFSFPRVAGGAVLPLGGMLDLGRGGASPSVRPGCPLPAGSRLYSPLAVSDEELASEAFAQREGLREGKSPAGCLYLTTAPFDGRGRLACAWLRRSDALRADPCAFVLDRDSYGPNHATFSPWACELWVVDALASRSSVGGKPRWRFDPAAAERQIAAAIVTSLEAIVPGGPVRAGVDREAVDGLISGAAQLRVDDVQPEAGEEAAVPDGVGPMSGLLARRGETAARPETGPLGATTAPTSGRTLRMPVSHTGCPLMPNRYVGAICLGCDRPIGEASWVSACGPGLVHNDARCYQRAASAAALLAATVAVPAAVLPEVADDPAERVVASPPVGPAAVQAGRVDRPAGPRVAQAKRGPNQRQAQQSAALGEARCALVRSCLEGRCGRESPFDMTCTGCGRGVHGQLCCQLARGYMLVGTYRCHVCRLQAMHPAHEGAFADGAISMALQTMLHAMVTSSEGMGSSFSDLASLQLRWAEVVQMGDASVTVVSPLDGVDSLESFLLWIVTGCARAKSLDSLWVALGSLMVKRGSRNLTRDPEVIAYYKQLRVDHGSIHEPKTVCTQRMARLLHTRVIPEAHASNGVICSRQLLIFSFEAVGGMRIGETVSGGDFHGVLADDVRLFTDVATGEEFVEAHLHHSKTKFSRYVTMQGTTRGEVAMPTAKYLRAYWQAAGFAMRPVLTEGGARVERPDYSVVRVSLLGFTQARLDLLCDLCESSAIDEVRRHSQATRERAAQRFAAKTSMDKRYVNVVGAASTDSILGRTVRELECAGFVEAGLVTITSGPLARATRGRLLTHMAIGAQTASEMSRLMLAADALANADPADPDPQRDLEGRDSPVFGEHSARRLADSNARLNMAETGATEQDIDLTLGWQEKFYSAKMQLHYEQRLTRKRRAACTSLM